MSTNIVQLPVEEIVDWAAYAHSFLVHPEEKHPLSLATFKHYRWAFEQGYGEFLDPISVFQTEAGWQLVEGTHRLAGAVAAKSPVINAVKL